MKKTESTPLKLPLSEIVDSEEHAHHISLFAAWMMLTTWSTSSSNVLYPTVFGRLGVVGGPVMMVCAFSISWKTTRWTIAAALETQSQTFGDLGHALGGRGGRLLMEGAQLLNQQIFLPVAIILCAGAVQNLAGAGNNDVGNAVPFFTCNGTVALLFSAVGFGLVQISRQVEHTSVLAVSSSVLMLLMTLCIAIHVSVNPAPPYVIDNSAGEGSVDVELLIGMGHHPQRYEWFNIFSAIGDFVYSCVPSAIVVETMAALKPEDRPKMKHAVDMTFATYIFIYILAGVPAAVAWGGDIPSPISFGNTTITGVVINLVLIFGTLLDFIFASIVVNRRVLRSFVPNFDYRWTFGNSLVWAFYCLPSISLAIGMALFIPKLDSLTTLLNSVAAATVQITAVPLLLYWTSNVDVQALKAKEGGPRELAFAAIICYGVMFSCVVFSPVIYSILHTAYIPGPSQSFWCDVVG